MASCASVAGRLGRCATFAGAYALGGLSKSAGLPHYKLGWIRVPDPGAFPALEDEMCSFGPSGLDNGRSPDRLDALVWALTHLMLAPKGRPRVRGM